MSKFCPDLNCSFYTNFPDGCENIAIEICFMCQKPFIDYKPEVQSVVTKPKLSLDTQGGLIVVNTNTLNIPTPQPVSMTVIPTENVVVIFRTAILLTHFKAVSSISHKFNYHFPRELNVSFSDLRVFKERDYRGDTYVLLENSISIPIAILDHCGSKQTLIIPYRYMLDGQEERFHSDKGITCRSLLLNRSNFSFPNIITKYDMIILPANLPADQQRDFKTLWRITFHLYIPLTEILRGNKLAISFCEIQSQVTNILFSLCYAYMICKTSKLILLTKTTYIQLFDSEKGSHFLHA